MDDDECLMLCSGQHKGRMLERISTGTSVFHVFETGYWCMFAGIEGSEDRHRKKSVMIKEDILLSQEGNQYLEEIVAAELATEDK